MVRCGWRRADGGGTIAHPSLHFSPTPQETRMKIHKTLVALAALLASAAMADVNVGISLSLTGPGSGLGIPMGNYYKLFPQTIAGEKLNVILLDDATDPGKGAQNARRFVTDDKVDIIIGS